MTVIRTSWELLLPKCTARAVDADHNFGMYQFTKSKTDTAVVKRLLMKENHLQHTAAC